MKRPLLAALVPLLTSPLAAEEVVTLGDSLTFSYEAEFCFRINTILGNYGDNMPAHVRNWIEILGSPSYRSARFDHGARKTIKLSIPLSPTKTLLFRHEHNWAIPGLTVDQLRRFALGEATILDLMAESDEFATLSTALSYSDFNEDEDFNVADMNAQITATAERLVLFIGGNDVRPIYGSVYDGNSAGTFTDDFIADADVVLDRIRELNPTLQIVVVAVPHIGITPDIKTGWPTDPVKTARVTALLRNLNGRLATLAEEHDAGFADIFTPTLPLLEASTWGIHGIAYSNNGSATGDLGSLWLNGELSANFHPNTQPQAVIANVIIDAFNRRYDTGIAPLTATEILGGLLGKSAAQIDMTFANWATGFGLTGLAQDDDSDRDGIPAAVEFATGLNPTLSDGDKVSSRLVNSGTPSFELAYPRRLPASPRYTLQATTNSDLSADFTPVTPVAGTDGLLRASIPVGSKGFLRLESTVAP